MQTTLLPTKSRMLNALMLVVAFVFGGMAAHAEGAGTQDDPWIFANGETYHVNAFKGFYGIFTAPADGTFSLSGTNYSIYTDATFTTQDESIRPIHNGDYQNTAYKFDCEAGKTYYIGNNFVMSSIDMVCKFLTEAETLSLRDLDPADGSVFNAGYGLVNLTFNQAVSVGAVELTAGNGVETISANVHGVYVSVDIKDVLNRFYKNGLLKAGDNIRIKFTSVAPTADATKLYNGTGIVEVNYKAGAMPLQVVSSTNTPDGNPAMTHFLSYYRNDNNSGIISLTFSGDVNMSEGNKPTVSLAYGNTEAEDPNESYSEMITPTVLAGNVLQIDLRNKLRRAKDMVTSGTNYGVVTLSVNSVKDMDGNYAYGNGSGNLGSFFYQYKFREVNYTPLTDWNTVGGANGVIDNETTGVELWLSEKKDTLATFTGAEMKYISGGEEKVHAFTISEISVTPDDEDDNARIVLIPIPDVSIDAGTEVTVSLTGIERPDGLTPDVEPTAFAKFSKTFTSAGRTDIIAAIVADGGGRVNVSTIGGTLLLKDADKAAVGRLDKGVYVINGKKVVIR